MYVGVPKIPVCLLNFVYYKRVKLVGALGLQYAKRFEIRLQNFKSKWKRIILYKYHNTLQKIIFITSKHKSRKKSKLGYPFGYYLILHLLPEYLPESWSLLFSLSVLLFTVESAVNSGMLNIHRFHRCGTKIVQHKYLFMLNITSKTHINEKDYLEHSVVMLQLTEGSCKNYLRYRPTKRKLHVIIFNCQHIGAASKLHMHQD